MTYEIRNIRRGKINMAANSIPGWGVIRPDGTLMNSGLHFGENAQRYAEQSADYMNRCYPDMGTFRPVPVKVAVAETDWEAVARNLAQVMETAGLDGNAKFEHHRTIHTR
jgi:hypothetical protein